MHQSTLSGTQKIAFQLNSHLNGTPPLVLLHGFCEDSSLWDNWCLAVPGMNIIRIDLPGFGQSDLPPSAGIDIYALAVKAVLDDLHIDQCVLVGHSLGGYTALEFAHQFPERLIGCGLFHSHPFADTPEQQENRRRGIEMVQSGKKNLYVAQLFPKLFSEKFAAVHPEILQKMIQRGQEQSAEGIVNALISMMNRSNHTDTLKKLRVPVLYLLGKHDGLIPPTEVLHIAGDTAQAEIQVLSDAAHMAMFEAPEQTQMIVKNFWTRCVRAAIPL
jgi:pimeloyl-ACP methyl ester carboxylesterase